MLALAVVVAFLGAAFFAVVVAAFFVVVAFFAAPSFLAAGFCEEELEIRSSIVHGHNPTLAVVDLALGFFSPVLAAAGFFSALGEAAFLAAGLASLTGPEGPASRLSAI